MVFKLFYLLIIFSIRKVYIFFVIINYMLGYDADRILEDVEANIGEGRGIPVLSIQQPEHYRGYEVIIDGTPSEKLGFTPLTLAQIEDGKGYDILILYERDGTLHVAVIGRSLRSMAQETYQGSDIQKIVRAQMESLRAMLI